jgi:Spy/CpxP family protein refolding chaperone
MKSIRNLLTATLTAGALLTAATGMSFAGAADAPTAAQPPPPPGNPGRHHHGEPWRLLGKLDLNAAQKQQIKEIMTAAHPQIQSLREQMHANSQKLWQAQPSDPNYASIASQASQTHGSLAAQMMTQRADLRAQVFKVLTPAQQTQLAALQAEKHRHKHGAWEGPGDE